MIKGIIRKKDMPDIILAAGTVSLIVSCLFLLAFPGYNYLKDKARVAAVKGNAVTLQYAAETYAARNQGTYPVDALDLLPFLPQDQAPYNPFTDERSIFDGSVGDLTYRSPTNGGDYIIEAWGPGDLGEPKKILVLKGK